MASLLRTIGFMCVFSAVAGFNRYETRINNRVVVCGMECPECPNGTEAKIRCGKVDVCPKLVPSCTPCKPGCYKNEASIWQCTCPPDASGLNRETSEDGEIGDCKTNFTEDYNGDCKHCCELKEPWGFVRYEKCKHLFQTCPYGTHNETVLDYDKRINQREKVTTPEIPIENSLLNKKIKKTVNKRNTGSSEDRRTTAQSESDSNPQSESDSNPQSESDSNPQSESDSNPQLESDSNPQSESDSNPQSESDSNPQSDSESKHKYLERSNKTLISILVSVITCSIGATILYNFRGQLRRAFNTNIGDHDDISERSRLDIESGTSADIPESNDRDGEHINLLMDGDIESGTSTDIPESNDGDSEHTNLLRDDTTNVVGEPMTVEDTETAENAATVRNESTEQEGMERSNNEIVRRGSTARDLGERSDHSPSQSRPIQNPPVVINQFFNQIQINTNNVNIDNNAERHFEEAHIYQIHREQGEDREKTAEKLKTDAKQKYPNYDSGSFERIGAIPIIFGEPSLIVHLLKALIKVTQDKTVEELSEDIAKKNFFAYFETAFGKCTLARIIIWLEWEELDGVKEALLDKCGTKPDGNL